MVVIADLELSLPIKQKTEPKWIKLVRKCIAYCDTRQENMGDEGYKDNKIMVLDACLAYISTDELQN